MEFHLSPCFSSLSSRSFHRCLSITCSVCSRTCTASAASQPPTPHLTWSSTPSPSPAGGSPRRSVLSLNSPNTNIISDPALTATSNAIAGKRRKFVDQDDLPRRKDGGDDREEFGPGCGRFLCRNCCFENIQKYVKKKNGFFMACIRSNFSPFT